MKRYIILAGCSYTYRAINYLSQLLGNTNIEIINIGANSAGNQFISESIMISVNALLKQGVLSKDIYVINNFTQIFRPVVKLPIEYHIKVQPLFADNNSDIRNVGNVTYKSCLSLIQIENQIYSFLVSKDGLTHEVKDWYNYQSDIYRVKRIVEQYFEIYLESIVLMQSFLKKHNIGNISFLMNNVFDGWQDEFTHIYTKNKDFSLPSTKGTKHISELSDYTKVLWDCIDLDSFVFHKTEENKYGGIDEYMLDKFPDAKYLNDKIIKGFYFGNHPNEVIYRNFTNEYMLDKLKIWNNEIHN
jgi:hypothetical protein